MRKTLSLLIVTSALVPVYAFAADTTKTLQASTQSDCDRLVTVLEQHKVSNPPATLAQAQAYKRDNNTQACHDAMMRPEMANADQANGTKITLQQTAPTVKVDQAAPQVTVQQAQPNVTVNQGQPEITVHQPAPTVTVDIPQPEITIRMPKPQVNVAMAEPNVQVNQPKPSVQVVQPAQPKVDVQPSQAQVDVQKSATQANVSVQNNQQAPKISYSSDQAKVVVNQAKTAPNIKVEQADQNQQNANTAGAGNSSALGTDTAAATQASTTDTRPVKASNLMNMDVLNAEGDKLGGVEHVLMNNKNHKPYVVIGHGGFLGLGEKRVALPVDSMFLRGNNLVMRGLTDDQIRGMPSWTRDNHDYTDFTASETTPISTQG